MVMNDSDLGRFLCPDAMWEKYISYTPYQYAGNDPINMVDWNGKWINYETINSKKNRDWLYNTVQFIKKNSSLGNNIIGVLENSKFEVSFNDNPKCSISCAGRVAIEDMIIDKNGYLKKIDVEYNFDNIKNQNDPLETLIKTIINESTHINQIEKADKQNEVFKKKIELWDESINIKEHDKRPAEIEANRNEKGVLKELGQKK